MNFLLLGVFVLAAAPVASAAPSWSAPMLIAKAAHSNSNSVSCVSSSFCVVVDGPIAVTFDGHAWSTPTSIDPSLGLASVSCVSSSFCVAVDYGGKAVTYDGHAWSAPSRVDGDANLLVSVSCVSSSFCVAVDDDGHAVTYDGSAWSPPTSLAFGLSSVSCVSPSFCVAVDAYGNAVTYDGHAWSAPSSFDGSGSGLGSVSCVSSSFCVAVDTGGNAVTYDGHSWSTPTSIDNSGAGSDSVSCVSSSFCVAVDDDGHAVTFDGHAWGAPTRLGISGRSLNSVSCVSASFCVAGDGRNVVTYDGSALLRYLRVSPASFWIATSRSRHHPPHLLFSLNVHARVSFYVHLKTVGARSGKHCVRRTHKLRKARRCLRYVKLAGGLHATAGAGKVSVPFTGRIAGRPLRPGSYQLRAIATGDKGKRSRVATATFRVLKPPSTKQTSKHHR